MKDVTIITGNSGVGKTTLAKKLTNKKTSVWIMSDIASDFFLKEVTSETEVIVFDGVDLTSKYNHNLIQIINQETITINRPGKYPIRIQRPEIIIVTNDPELYLDFLPSHVKEIQIRK